MFVVVLDFLFFNVKSEKSIRKVNWLFSYIEQLKDFMLPILL